MTDFCSSVAWNRPQLTGEHQRADSLLEKGLLMLPEPCVWGWMGWIKQTLFYPNTIIQSNYEVVVF